MADPRPPPCVLLERVVRFVEAAGLTSGGASRDADVAATIEAGGWSWSRVQMMGSAEEMERRMAPSVKPVAFLADPPQASSLHMLLPPPARTTLLGIGEISGTHKGIVVIYAHRCYLLYDASNNHITAIPPVPDSVFVPLGRSAVLVSAAGADDDDYILADIRDQPRAPQGHHLRAGQERRRVDPVVDSSPPSPSTSLWPTYFFHIDTAFSFAGTIFWVDLLKGILICDEILSSPQGPRLVFVPLRHCIDAHDKPRHCFSPDGHRSIGRVSGAIKFLALIGYCEEASCPANEVKLKTWSLSPDFKHWKEETTLTVGDIWASESFNQDGIMYAVNEDGIMYAVLNHVKEEPIPRLNEFGDSLGIQLVPKANYMIRFDMLQNKVLSSTKISKKPTFRWFTMTFLASDFSAYLQDRQVLNLLTTATLIATHSTSLADHPNHSIDAYICHIKMLKQQARFLRKRMSSRQAGRSKRQGQAEPDPLTSEGRPTALVRPFGIGRSRASTADRLGPYGRKNSPRGIDTTSEPQQPAPLGSKWGRGGLCAVAATAAACTSRAGDLAGEAQAVAVTPTATTCFLAAPAAVARRRRRWLIGCRSHGPIFLQHMGFV
uniref:DUF1618 domain-containing protein n=1 Tax=Oryza meridionalis TaxID=40149 RepID=A0A0E0BWB0_9ORYZ